MSDQRILYNEYMVGAGHPSLANTLSRQTDVEHSTDGTHGKAITQLTASHLVKADAAKILAPSAMVETAAGIITNPSQPAFLAFKSATTADQTGDGYGYSVICDTEIFDQGSNYDPITGIFTAPVPGPYHFDLKVDCVAVAVAHNDFACALVASNRTLRGEEETFAAGAGPYVGTKSLVASGLIDMDAGDTVYGTLVVCGGTRIVDILGHGTILVTHFSGRLVH